MPEGETREGYLRRLMRRGLGAPLSRSRHGEPELRQRLDFELGVLGKTGFTSYFLIVWDFIDYAKRNGIPVGPGSRQCGGQPDLRTSWRSPILIRSSTDFSSSAS